MRTALIVFAKVPVAGLAKTRLAPVLGPAGAAALARRMLEHALSQARIAGLGPIELCTTPDTAHPTVSNAASAHGAVLTEQGPGDLGQRMHRAFERCLHHHSQAMLIGTDSPSIDARMLREAASALDAHPAVFVPARDGGYALVGLKKADPRWFIGMTWSHPRVMQDTRDRLQAAGVGWRELEAVTDIDEPADLVHLPQGWLADLPIRATLR